MARVTGTVTVAAFLFFFAVSQAQIPSDLEKKAVGDVPETVLPESDSKLAAATNNLLLLPSEKPETETEIEVEIEKPEIETEIVAEIESDTGGVVGWNLETTEAELTESSETSDDSSVVVEATELPDEETESDSDSDANSNSVSVLSFRPANHRFRRLPFPFRRGHRCHHHHHNQRGRERSYGNDMIMSEEGAKAESLLRDRWMRFRERDDMRMHHHRLHRMHHDRDEHDEHENDGHEYHHHEHEHEHDEHEHHHHEHDHEHDDEHEHHHHHHHHEHEHEQPNVLVRKIRKFLMNFHVLN